jgi:hypothetical protein
MNRYDNPEIADSIAELCSGMSDRLDGALHVEPVHPQA